MNKFIDKNGSGHRGVLLALSGDGKQAIIEAKTNSFESELAEGGIVKAGNMYMVIETNPGQYPIVVKKTKTIPKNYVPVTEEE